MYARKCFSMSLGRRAGFFLIVALLAFSGAGCSKATPFTLPATPVLEPAGTFTLGQNDIPAGKYLAVELWNDTDGHATRSGACGAPVMIDFPMYGLDGNRLEMSNNPLSYYPTPEVGPQGLPQVVGFYGHGSSMSGEAGGGANSDVDLIPSLPAKLDNGFITLYSVVADASIVVQIDKQVYRLKRGERWVRYYVDYPDPHCRMVTTTAFRNYGLLDATQIKIQSTPLAPRPTPTP